MPAIYFHAESINVDALMRCRLVASWNKARPKRVTSLIHQHCPHPSRDHLLIAVGAAERARRTVSTLRHDLGRLIVRAETMPPGQTAAHLTTVLLQLDVIERAMGSALILLTEHSYGAAVRLTFERLEASRAGREP